MVRFLHRRLMDSAVLFVTGMQRSGTTLLEKLLGRHPDLSLLSQPFPLLFVEVKREFLRRLGRSGPRYPLGHLFLEDGYRPEDFARHLSELRLEGSRVLQICQAMDTFSGQYTRLDFARLERLIPQLPAGDFAAILAALYHAFAPEPRSPVVGGKETICEEFLPYLLDRGCGCVLILRDPRDVVASLNHGRGQEYGGMLKPTLFNIRNWRKSVAFALHLDGHPAFQWLRYEDLVADPLAAMNRLLRAFGRSPIAAETVAGEIRDRSDRVWRGNSSYREHRGVSASSVGAYRGVLSSEVARFIEAACLPELRLLGYPCDLETAEAADVLRAFEEPYEIAREGMDRDLAGPANADLEIRRLELLGGEPSAAALPYFLFERAHARLREAWSR